MKSVFAKSPHDAYDTQNILKHMPSPFLSSDYVIMKDPFQSWVDKTVLNYIFVVVSTSVLFC